MSYAHAIEELYSLGHELSPADGSAPRRKFDLEQMRALARALGHPERRFPSVLIAGTNGKGSTAATLASIGTAAGYRVGLYTSPHLSRVNERIRINSEDIADEDFARLYFRVDHTAAGLLRDNILPHHPSFFEMLTAVAFLYFAERAVDLAVLEVGIGGRLDATNIVQPMVSIITDVSLDHMEWLGSTIGSIAREKAGILRPNGTLVTLPQHPEANQAIGEAATVLGARAVNAARYLPARAGADFRSSAEACYPIDLDGASAEIFLPLAGSHQQRNAALAIAAAVELRNRHGYNITNESIVRGIRQTRWPARLEYFPATAERCAVLLDVAHNPAGAWTLRAAIASGLPDSGRSRTLLFGCMRDKAFEEMAQVLFPLFDRVVTTPVDSPRSASAEALASAAQPLGIPATTVASPKEGFLTAVQQTGADDLLVCAGSVYLAGAVRTLLLQQQRRA